MGSTVLDFITDGAVQTSEIAIDFGRIALDDDFSRNFSNRCEVEHARFLSLRLGLIVVVSRASEAEEYSFQLRSS